MGSYASLVKDREAITTLRVVDTGVNVCFTQEEAHELFERILNSNADDTPASAQALKKLATAIGTSFGG